MGFSNIVALAIFALGIVGTGLLAVPVLAGSAAYAVGETLRWPTGLDRKPKDAKAFYATIAVATLIGVGLNFTPINPIRALYWSAVINGVVAVPIMAMMMLMSVQPRIMGKQTIGGTLRVFGWLSTAVMLVTAVAMIVTSFFVAASPALPRQSRKTSPTPERCTPRGIVVVYPPHQEKFYGS